MELECWTLNIEESFRIGARQADFTRRLYREYKLNIFPKIDLNTIKPAILISAWTTCTDRAKVEIPCIPNEYCDECIHIDLT
jgi:hypothetical protein